MLKVIHSEGNFRPLNGKIYKKEIVDLFELKRKVKRNAEKKSQLIIDKAKYEAEELKQIAFSIGYHDGFKEVVEDLVSFIKQNISNISSIRNNILDDIEKLLYSVIDNNDVFMSILSNWLRKKNLNSERLILKIPESYREREDEMINNLSRIWMGEITVLYHESNKVVINCDQLTAEFDIPKFISETLDVIAEKYDMILTESMKDICFEKEKKLMHDFFVEKQATQN